MRAVTADEKLRFAHRYYTTRDLEQAFADTFPQECPPPGSSEVWRILAEAKALLWDPIVRERLKVLFAGEELPKEMSLPRTPYLSGRKKVFVDWYLELWNGPVAAARAGFKDPVGAARDLLRDPNVLAEIQRNLEWSRPLQDEVIYRLRQFSMLGAGDFVVAEKDPETGQVTPRIDWEKVSAMGWGVKKIRPTQYGYDIEVHDALRALELLARAMGMLQPPTIRNEHVGPGGGELVFRVEYADDIRPLSGDVSNDDG